MLFSSSKKLASNLKAQVALLKSIDNYSGYQREIIDW